MPENQQHHEPDEHGEAQEPSRDLVPRGQAPESEPLAEQRRQFEEFQRFQAYLHYTQSQGTGDGAGAQQAPPHEQLAAIQQQLGELTASQQRTERQLNPPLWKKVLRSHWLYRLVVLVILIVAAGWVYDYFFGSSEESGRPVVPSAAPGHQGGLPAAYPRPDRTVNGLYAAIASDDPGTCNLFTGSGKREFARDFAAKGCPAAIRDIRQQVTDTNAYSILRFQGAIVSKNANTAVISSCLADVSGGPSLGKFTLTKLETGGWYISGHSPETCAQTPEPTH